MNNRSDDVIPEWEAPKKEKKAVPDDRPLNRLPVEDSRGPYGEPAQYPHSPPTDNAKPGLHPEGGDRPGSSSGNWPPSEPQASGHNWNQDPTAQPTSGQNSPPYAQSQGQDWNQDPTAQPTPGLISSPYGQSQGQMWHPSGQAMAPQFVRIPHSGPGIASLVIGIVGMLVLLVIMIASAGIIANQIGPDQEITPEVIEGSELFGSLILVGLGALGSFVLMLVGFVLGIIGLLQKFRKKALAIAGTVLNGLVVVPVVFVFLFGVLLGGTS